MQKRLWKNRDMRMFSLQLKILYLPFRQRFVKQIDSHSRTAKQKKECFSGFRDEKHKSLNDLLQRKMTFVEQAI